MNYYFIFIINFNPAKSFVSEVFYLKKYGYLHVQFYRFDTGEILHSLYDQTLNFVRALLAEEFCQILEGFVEFLKTTLWQ